MVRLVRGEEGRGLRKMEETEWREWPGADLDLVSGTP